MINNMFALWGPGPLELLIILIVFGIPVLVIALVIRYILRNDKEKRKLRLEVGKLADELEQVRKQAEGGKKVDASAKSE